MVIVGIWELILASGFIAFVSAFLVTPFIMKNSKNAGIVGADRNKKGEKIPEMGGIAIVAGISMGLLLGVALGFNTVLENRIQIIQILLATLATVVIMGILGIIDDLYNLKQMVKAPIPFIAAIPLSAVRAGTRTLNIPFIGLHDFGSLYPLVLVPLGVGGASNAFNMLAGLNGLEAGMGIIISLAIFIAAFAKGSIAAMIISISLLSACLAFFIYNKFPAKIFPGDVGTYVIGATIASAVIVGNLEFFGLVLFAPYFLEFALKSRGGFRGQNFGILKDGKLFAPKKIESLTHIIMRLGKFTEGEIVNRILLIEVAIASIALVLFVY